MISWCADLITFLEKFHIYPVRIKNYCLNLFLFSSIIHLEDRINESKNDCLALDVVARFQFGESSVQTLKLCASDKKENKDNFSEFFS